MLVSEIRISPIFFFQFERFFDEHPNQGAAARSIKFSIDRIKANVKWMESSFSSLSDWLAESQRVVTQSKLDYRLPNDLISLRLI